MANTARPGCVQALPRRNKSELGHCAALARPSSLCGGWGPWRFDPAHECQGVGCRCWDVSVPDGERRSCERKLGRGIRPALNLKIPLTLCCVM